MFEYKRESELRDFLCQNMEQYFGCKLTHKELSLSGWRIDIVGETDDTIFLIELKRNFITKSTITQLKKYLKRYKKDVVTNKKVVGIAAAPFIKIRRKNIPKYIEVKTLKNVKDISEYANKSMVELYLDPLNVRKIKGHAFLLGTTVSQIVDKLISDYLDKK